jgi:hypothetical protein
MALECLAQLRQMTSLKVRSGVMLLDDPLKQCGAALCSAD